MLGSGVRMGWAGDVRRRRRVPSVSSADESEPAERCARSLDTGSWTTTRTLGLVVGRGTSVVLVCPTDGMEAIENPFAEEG